MYEDLEKNEFVFDDNERPVINAARWPISDAVGLLIAAEQKRDQVAARDPSEYPAGSSRAQVISEQWQAMNLLDSIIDQVGPSLASSIPADADRFLHS